MGRAVRCDILGTAESVLPGPKGGRAPNGAVSVSGPGRAERCHGSGPAEVVGRESSGGEGRGTSGAGPGRVWAWAQLVRALSWAEMGRAQS